MTALYFMVPQCRDLTKFIIAATGALDRRLMQDRAVTHQRNRRSSQSGFISQLWAGAPLVVGYRRAGYLDVVESCRTRELLQRAVRQQRLLRKTPPPGMGYHKASLQQQPGGQTSSSHLDADIFTMVASETLFDVRQ
jgi:hypothetical protein